MKSHLIIANSGIGFGTSGARGLVEDFTPNVNAAFTAAFLSSDNSYKKVAIAIDNRPSSPQIASDCIQTAYKLGIEVDYYGVLPTPALAYQAMQDGIPAIMVTGSHIPFDRNGIKFYRPDGEITKEDEQAIVHSTADVPKIKHKLSLPEINSKAEQSYIHRYTSIYPDSLLKNKRIGIYEHSSAGRDLYFKVFEALGATVVRLGRSDTFVPIDTEAVAKEDIEQSIAWTKKHNLDAVFSTDGDGDRPLLSDETGGYLRGDILCLLAAKSLGVDALAVPVSCNSSIEKSGYFKEVTRTKIGSPYVIESFSILLEEYLNVAGFEANGGFLLASDIDINDNILKALPTRDALLPVLSILAESVPVAEQVAALPAVFTHSDRVVNFHQEKIDKLLHLFDCNKRSFFTCLNIDDSLYSNVDKTDGLRMYFSGGTVVHIRPSGNAPELRIYVEATTVQATQQLTEKVVKSIQVNLQ